MADLWPQGRIENAMDLRAHTTNYQNMFIQVAEDCPAEMGEEPPTKAEKSIANLQFDMLISNPYKFTSDDVLFAVHAVRKKIPQASLAAARVDFFSKGQPCFRASPLTKRYGWGVHSDAKGKIALFGMESKEYKAFAMSKAVKNVRAMRSSK